MLIVICDPTSTAPQAPVAHAGSPDDRGERELRRSSWRSLAVGTLVRQASRQALLKQCPPCLRHSPEPNDPDLAPSRAMFGP